MYVHGEKGSLIIQHDRACIDAILGCDHSFGVNGNSLGFQLLGPQPAPLRSHHPQEGLGNPLVHLREAETGLGRKLNEIPLRHFEVVSKLQLKIYKKKCHPA